MKRRIGIVLLALLLYLGCGQKTGQDSQQTVTFRYEPNGAAGEAVTLAVPITHKRLNTAQGDLFTRDGYTLYGWNTEADGSGVSIGLGSRADARDQTLYAQWAKWSDEADFAVENGVITSYSGADDCVAVPEFWHGEPIHAISEGAFAGCKATVVILPPTLKTVSKGAFENAKLETLYLFDSLQSINDYAFTGCEQLTTLHINAATAPVYAGSYYSTFADKCDRLFSLADQKKIVLFSGSSARFGYDSAAIDEAFSGYAVVNMGVFAYTNALPQMELIRAAMQPDDILLLSPELDAAKRQFCTTNALDAPFFNLMEENYDLFALLDLEEYTRVFSSFSEYLSVKCRMDGKDYSVSPNDFDEDGNPVSTPSYNDYGDYILYRPNADSDAPIYGLPVPYTASYYRKEQYIDPMNAELDRFTDGGVRVYMTYSPRNRLAVSEDSTEEAIRELDAYFRETLHVPVISDMMESLVDGRYLFGTDNHLSTEGVKIRTESVIRDLRSQLAAEGVVLPRAQSRVSLFGGVRHPLVWVPFLLALLCLWIGNRRRIWALPYAGGFLWALAVVAAFVTGAAESEILCGTLALALAAALSGKRGENA